jgi:hypothetical protein
MRKLDNQVLSSYQKMVEESAAPLPPKQSIFSPSAAKDRTPIKRGGRDRTPSKTENQRSASRRIYRSTSRERAMASQALTGDKKSSVVPHEVIYAESKEVADAVKKLTGVINEKQKLIVGITKKLGEFIVSFRDVRGFLNQLKEVQDLAEDIETIERLVFLITK